MRTPVIEADVKKIQSLIKGVLGAESYLSIQKLGGLTNHTYRVDLPDGQSLAVRIPGEGTEDLINRADEYTSTRLACTLGIDADLLYFGEDGSKVSLFIHDAETLSPKRMREENIIRLAANVLKRLHTCGQDTLVPFEVFHMAETYEKIIQANGVDFFEDYSQTKNKIMKLKDRVDKQRGSIRVPCHNDPLCENWILSKGTTLYLIDWEYAGMNDPMWDLADVSIEANYSEAEDFLLLESYLNHSPTENEVEYFHANKIYLDYLWALWGKTRVPFDGEPMEQYALERYLRLKDNLCRIV